MSVEETVTRAADRFPFLMVLTTTILNGTLFILLNGPLLWLTVGRRTFADSNSLYSTGVSEIWVAVSKVNAAWLSALLFVLLVC